jgi:hypothetical protein
MLRGYNGSIEKCNRDRLPEHARTANNSDRLISLGHPALLPVNVTPMGSRVIEACAKPCLFTTTRQTDASGPQETFDRQSGAAMQFSHCGRSCRAQHFYW